MSKISPSLLKVINDLHRSGAVRYAEIYEAITCTKAGSTDSSVKVSPMTDALPGYCWVVRKGNNAPVQVLHNGKVTGQQVGSEVYVGIRILSGIAEITDVNHQANVDKFGPLVANAIAAGPLLSPSLVRPLHNYTATRDPTVDDDELLGYSVNSEWTNTATNTRFTCRKADAGAADWMQLAEEGVVQATLDFPEIAAPSNPAANFLRVYAADNQGITGLKRVDSSGRTLTFGEDGVLLVRNVTGSSIAKGKAVYLSSISGGVFSITLARSNSASTMPATVTNEAIANNAFGYVKLFGIVSGFDTSAFSAGDKLYVSSATAGLFQNTAPAAPNLIQLVAQVITSHVSSGSVWVLPIVNADLWAPPDATYIVQVASGGLSSEQALGALATGLLKNTTTTGVLSIGVAGTDYAAPHAELSFTTTGNIDALAVGTAPVTLIRMNNATLATIRGIVEGVAGQVIIIDSVGAGQVDLQHDDGVNPATAARRLSNNVTTTNTSLSPGKGRAIYQYDITTARWRLQFHEQGSYITYTPAWGASGTAPALNNGTITGNYKIRGNMIRVTVNLVMGSTTTYGTGFYNFSLPVARSGPAEVANGYGQDLGVAHYTSTIVFASTTTVNLIDNKGAGAWGQTVPFTWGNTDFLQLTIEYQIA